jgi:hypothetical protein
MVASVTLRWGPSPDQNCRGWAGYVAWRATGATGGTFTALNNTPVKALTLRDVAVKRGQTYRYYVTALVGKVPSKPSNTATVTVH